MTKQAKKKLFEQAYSFVKTYITVFIGIVVFAEASGTDVFSLAFLIPAVKASLISVLRNIYKLLTEKQELK